MRDEKGTGKNRRAHLRDFVLGANGRYVYRGDTYRFAGSASERCRAYAAVGAFALLSLAASVAAGCIPAAGMENCFYVILPWLVSVICDLLLALSACRLLLSSDPLRAYVYRKSAELLPSRATASAIAPAACLLGETVYLILNGADGKIPLVLLFIALLLLSSASAYLLRRRATALRYERIAPSHHTDGD